MAESQPAGERPSPIRPRDLLRHARRAIARYPALAGSGGGPSVEAIAQVFAALPQPSEADYRRAVSAAYYALFHAMTLEAARFLADRAGDFQRYHVARHFQHRDVRRVALWAIGAGTPPEPLASQVDNLLQNARVRPVAEAFRFLSDARAKADYDHFAQFTESRTLDAIRRAEGAVATIEDGTLATTPAGRTFLELIADQVRSNM